MWRDCAGQDGARAGGRRTTLTDREKLNLVVVRECSGERGDVDTGDLSSSSLPRSSSSSLMEGSKFFPEPISMSCCCTKGVEEELIRLWLSYQTAGTGLSSDC